MRAVSLGLLLSCANAKKHTPANTDAATPDALLLVVKGRHVGSVWLKELFELQAPAASFVHEANKCVQPVAGVVRLLDRGECEKSEPAPLAGLSFNTGNFGTAGLSVWAKAAREARPAVQRPRVLVVSLIRTNAAKWAWSVYRHQSAGQESHVYADASAGRPSASGAVQAPPAKVPTDEIAQRMVHMAPRQRAVQNDAVQLARVLNATVVVHLTYEGLREDAQGAMSSLFRAAGVPFSAEAHRRGTSLQKGAPEDLGRAIANLDDLRAEPSLTAPCYQSMFSPKNVEIPPCDGGAPWLT